VSVADLEPGKEWIVGPPFPADVCYHKGEFYFELLAALFKRADLIFTSGGFAAVLGAAVETPVISIKGGFEPASWHADCGKFSPYLAVTPITLNAGAGLARAATDARRPLTSPTRATINRFIDKIAQHSVKAGGYPWNASPSRT
jgi:hypothetical protein